MSLSVSNQVSSIQELVESIIDELRDSPETLKSCSLVTSNWVSRSRWHLVWELEMTPPSINHISGRDREKLIDETKARYDKLLDILDSPQCTFYASVYRLVFRGARDVERAPCFTTDQEWLEPLLSPSRLAKWTGVTELWFDDICHGTVWYSEAWKNFFAKDADARVVNFREKIEYLSLVHLPVRHPKTVLEIVGSVSLFPAVEELQIGLYVPPNIYVGHDPAIESEMMMASIADLRMETAKLGEPPKKLTALEMFNRWSVWVVSPCRVLWSWFTVKKVVLETLTIKIDLMTPGDFYYLEDYLTQIGPELKYLDFTTAFHGDYEFPPEAAFEKRLKLRLLLAQFHIDRILAQSTSITDVSIEHVFFYDVRNKCPMSLMQPRRFLDAIPGTSLERLTIYVRADMSIEAEDINADEERDEWKEADAILANATAFPRLEKVALLVYIGSEIKFSSEEEAVTAKDIEDYLRPLFTGCEERGILYFN